MVREIEYTAPPSVTNAIALLGRTEDLRFSPSNRRLAVVGFTRNQITVFDIDIASSRSTKRVTLTGGVQFSSPALQSPHSVDFIDDDTLIVTSRGSAVGIFEVPPSGRDLRCYEVDPILGWPAGAAPLFNVPGSVSVARLTDKVCEILICNNAGHSVTRHPGPGRRPREKR